jgi:hypothetical protein
LRAASARLHPLLGWPYPAPFEEHKLAAFYAHESVARSRLDTDFELCIARGQSALSLDRPLQLGVRAKRDYKAGEAVLFYGGRPTHSDDLKMPTAPQLVEGRPASHARRIAASDFVLDGLPFAMMFERPVPGTLQRLDELCAAAVKPLLPTAANYTTEQLQRFHGAQFGFMVNTATVRMLGQRNNCRVKEVRFDEHHSLPLLVTSRAVAAGEELLCAYNSNESHELRDNKENRPRKRKADEEDEDVACDVCEDGTWTERNPIVRCGVLSCSRGRHRLCWPAGQQPALPQIARMSHLCQQHTPEAGARRGRAACSAPPPNHAPLHNLPPRFLSADAGAATQQIYLPPAHWQAGVRHNCKQLQLLVRQSTLLDGGKGLFPDRYLPRHTLVGWLWGKFVTESVWHEMVRGSISYDPTAQVFEEHVAADVAEEDYVNEAQSGVWRCIDPEGLDEQSSRYVLLVSRQCPLGYANDSRNSEGKHAYNIAIDWKARRAVSDISSEMSWQLLPVSTTRAVKSGHELFIDYGWTKAQWRLSKRCARLSADAESPSQPAVAAAAPLIASAPPATAPLQRAPQLSDQPASPAAARPAPPSDLTRYGVEPNPGPGKPARNAFLAHLAKIATPRNPRPLLRLPWEEVPPAPPLLPPLLPPPRPRTPSPQREPMASSAAVAHEQAKLHHSLLQAEDAAERAVSPPPSIDESFQLSPVRFPSTSGAPAATPPPRAVRLQLPRRDGSSTMVQKLPGEEESPDRGQHRTFLRGGRGRKRQSVALEEQPAKRSAALPALSEEPGVEDEWPSTVSVADEAAEPPSYDPLPELSLVLDWGDDEVADSSAQT